MSIQLRRAPNALDSIHPASPIGYLWKKDAIRARRIILGLVAAKKEGIDIAQIETNSLLSEVEQIGRSREFPMV